MVDESKILELKRMIDEADYLRVKHDMARDVYTRDGEALDRLERTIAGLDREIVETSSLIGRPKQTQPSKNSH